MLQRALFALVALIFLSGEGHAGEALRAKDFFQPFLSHPTIAPDGAHLAAVVARGPKETIVVRGTKDPRSVPIYRNEEFGWRIKDLFWESPGRLLFELESFQSGVHRRRFWAINRDGTRLQAVGDFVSQPEAGIISVLRDRPNLVLLGVAGSAFELDILHGSLLDAVAEHDAVWRWFADTGGVPRAGASSRFAKRSRLLARVDPTKDFVVVGDFEAKKESGLSFAAFGDVPNSLYVYSHDPNARRTLKRIDLNEAEAGGSVVYEHPDYDVGAVVHDPSGRAIGIDTIVDYSERHHWDAAAAKVQRGLDAALAAPVNRIVGSSWDGKQRLVRSSGPSTAPSYYLLEAEVGDLSPLFSEYPALDEAPLAEVKPIRFVARDGLALRAYLTRPLGVRGPAPTVVLVHDRSAREPGRDWLRFDPLVQFLASRGFAILQVNYRGSGGYGSPFAEAGRDEWGLRIQTDLEDGVRSLVEQGLADPERIGIFGHGFGGYTALMGIVRNPDFYAAAAAWGAPSDLSTWAREGKNDWGELSSPGEPAVGAWASRKRVSAASPYDHVESITVPLLLGHGASDERVDINQSLRLQRELTVAGKECLLLRFEDEHSQITRDDQRVIFYEKLADFFAKHLGAAKPAQVED